MMPIHFEFNELYHNMKYIIFKSIILLLLKKLCLLIYIYIYIYMYVCVCVYLLFNYVVIETINSTEYIL